MGLTHYSLVQTSSKDKQSEIQYLLVLVNVNSLELTEADEVRADKNAQLATFLFTFLTITSVTLVLHAYPELVHLSKVELNEIDRVFNAANICVTSSHTHTQLKHSLPQILLQQHNL